MSPRSLQSVDPLAQVDDHVEQVSKQRDKVWLTAAHAAEYLDFPTVKAFRLWTYRHGIKAGRVGRALRYLRADLDAAVVRGR